MKIYSLLLAAMLIAVFVGSFSCTTNPILVEVMGPPIDTSNMDTIVLLVEADLCDNGVISFERQILPLVVAGCAYSGCHDAETAEEDVILEDYNSIRKEVTPGNAANSELYKSITEDPNNDEFMPPKPAIALTSEEVNLIKEWINQGAENTMCNVPCNSENASYAANVKPLIDMHCLGCHQPTNALGNVNLIDYDHVRSIGITGQLVGSIKYIAGLTPMPETSLKMTDCQIATIQNWITEGSPNN